MSTTLDIRCPVGPQRLLARLLRTGTLPVTDGVVWEFACYDCAKALRRQGKPDMRVLHHFDNDGVLIDSITEARPTGR